MNSVMLHKGYQTSGCGKNNGPTQGHAKAWWKGWVMHEGKGLEPLGVEGLSVCRRQWLAAWRLQGETEEQREGIPGVVLILRGVGPLTESLSQCSRVACVRILRERGEGEEPQLQCGGRC